jgi:endoglucanase
MSTKRQRSAVIALAAPPIAAAVFLGGSTPALGATSSAPPVTATVLAATAMSLPAAQGGPVSDPAAAGGQSLIIWGTGTATATVTLPATTDIMVVRARGDQCLGAPQMSVTVDGRTLLSTPVQATTWTDYRAPAALGAGNHKVGVSFTNDYVNTTCDRNLYLDKVTWTVSAPTPTPSPGVTGNPFAGAHGYVDPNSDAKHAADARRSWDASGAAALDKVASGSTPTWYGNWNPTDQVAATVSADVTKESAAGALPVLVAYNIPYRDCGGYSSGGSTTADAYRAWIAQMAAGIGKHQVAVLLEPDAVAQLVDCLTDAQKTERLALLAQAVDMFDANPGTSVYIDAGNPGWVAPDLMAGWLKSAGLSKARGFAVNVSNYAFDATSRAYGADLSSRVGGKPFIVDTSRNGQGPGDTWCNPAGRGLGQRFTVPANDPVVDVYTWLRGPGGSDGTCNGGSSAGTFWVDYAIGLGQRASFQ